MTSGASQGAETHAVSLQAAVLLSAAVVVPLAQHATAASTQRHAGWLAAAGAASAVGLAAECALRRRPRAVLLKLVLLLLALASSVGPAALHRAAVALFFVGLLGLQAVALHERCAASSAAASAVALCFAAALGVRSLMCAELGERAALASVVVLAERVGAATPSTPSTEPVPSATATSGPRAVKVLTTTASRVPPRKASAFLAP